MYVVRGYGGKWFQEHLTYRLLVFAFFYVALGNFLASLSLIQMRSLDEFSLLPSNSKMLLLV